MGLGRTILFFSGITLAIYVADIIKYWDEDVPVPVLDKAVYWGPGASHRDDETIREFKINVSDEVSSFYLQSLNRVILAKLVSYQQSLREIQIQCKCPGGLCQILPVESTKFPPKNNH